MTPDAGGSTQLRIPARISRSRASRKRDLSALPNGFPPPPVTQRIGGAQVCHQIAHCELLPDVGGCEGLAIGAQDSRASASTHFAANGMSDVTTTSPVTTALGYPLVRFICTLCHDD